MSPPLPALIGHRALPLLAPENTAASLRCAADHEIRWIEVDVTMAGDGTLVMMHDLTLARFGQPDQHLADLTRSDLESVDAGHWFSPEFVGEPLLFFPDFLQLADELRLNVNLEIKINPALNTLEQVTAVHQTLLGYTRRYSQLLVSSFDLTALQTLRQLSPDMVIGALFEDLPMDIVAAVRAIEPASIHCDQSRLTEAQAKAVAQHFPLYCYTVNETVTFARLLDWGVSGVFCDRAHAEDMRSLAIERGLPVE